MGRERRERQRGVADWRRWSGVECDRVPPPRASPVESAASRVFSLSLRVSLVISLPHSVLCSLFYTAFCSFPSVPISRTLSLLCPTPTPAPLGAASWLDCVARRGCGGTAGVAWTEINIRRASTYSCPLAHTLPVSLMFVSPAVHPSFSHPPRTSTAFLVRRTEGTPRSRLCPALYLGFTGRPHPSPCPPSLIHSATPPFPRGWTNTHTHEQKHTYVHVQTRSEERERTLWQTKHFCTGCVSTCNGWLYNAGRILENSLTIKE